MARKEFSRSTKRDALERSGNRCEASGERYGFDSGVRCNCHLSLGVIFDHDVPDQLGGDNSIENCRAICIACNRIKTRGDIRQIRKADRQRDRHSGVVRPAGKIKSAGFAHKPKPEKLPIPKRKAPMFAAREEQQP